MRIILNQSVFNYVIEFVIRLIINNNNKKHVLEKELVHPYKYGSWMIE